MAYILGVQLIIYTKIIQGLFCHINFSLSNGFSGSIHIGLRVLITNYLIKLPWRQKAYGSGVGTHEIGERIGEMEFFGVHAGLGMKWGILKVEIRYSYAP